MKWFLRIVSTLASVASGLLVGVYFLFVGGIIDIVNSMKSNMEVPMDMAIGILKVLLAAPLGWITFYVCISVSLLTIEVLFASVNNSNNKRKEVKRVPEKDRPKGKGPNLFGDPS